MTLLNEYGRFYDGSLINIYCEKCEKATNHRVFSDNTSNHEKMICTRCRKVRALPEEYRMRELRQPMLYKELE